MKKKWALGISILVLCVSALAFGVFSVKQSSLFVGTTISFNASNCSANVKCEINNYADENGQKNSKTVQTNILASSSTSSGSLDIGTVNFYRSGTGASGIDPFEIVLTITNLSSAPSQCTITAPQLSSSGISVSYGYNNEYASFMPYTFQLLSGESLSFPITYTKIYESELSATDFGISLNITDYTVPTLSSLTSQGWEISGTTLTGVPSSDTQLCCPKMYKDSNDQIVSITTIGNGSSVLNNLTAGYYRNILIPNGVTSIAGCAFKLLDSSSEPYVSSVCLPETLTIIGGGQISPFINVGSVNIPKSVQRIIDGAFGGCSISGLSDLPNLTYIGEYAFSGCSVNSDLSGLPNLRTIGAYAFYNSTGITNVDLTASTKLSWIGGDAFVSSDIESIKLPNNLQTLDGFRNCTSLQSIEIPDSVTTIVTGCFYGCTALTSVKLSKNLVTIGSSAFVSTKIKTIALPSSVNSIGSYAFADCRQLTSLTIQNGVKTIGQGAFSRCSGLTRLTIPSSVTEIGALAFESCASLQRLDIPFVGTGEMITNSEAGFGNAKYYDTLHYVFSSTLYSADDSSKFYQATISINEMVQCSPYIPTSLTTIWVTNAQRIGDYGFYAMSSIKTVYLNQECKHIGNHAFISCTSLTYVNLNTVLTIGDNAFNGCSSLGALELNANIVSVHKDAFVSVQSPNCKLFWMATDYDDSVYLPYFINANGETMSVLYFYSPDASSRHSCWHYNAAGTAYTSYNKTWS